MKQTKLNESLFKQTLTLTEDYNAGVKSRQTEVDELQSKSYELQKRVDEALEELDSYFGDNYPVLKAIKILKGNQNES